MLKILPVHPLGGNIYFNKSLKHHPPPKNSVSIKIPKAPLAKMSNFLSKETVDDDPSANATDDPI